MRVWRIASAAHAPCEGEGARRYGSRWTPRGLPAIFASATLSLAALERFVHTDPDLDRVDLVAIPIEIDSALGVESISVAGLPPDWRTLPAPAALADLGARWARQRRTSVLSVPSVVIPHERNFVLNPAHADFGRIKIGRQEPFSFDPRMWTARR